MLHETPLRKRHEAAAAHAARATDEATARVRPGAATGERIEVRVEYISYGPPDDDGLVTCEVPSTFGEVEGEYAAIRRGAGLMDCPHRGAIRVRGSDRREFLDRMLTQSLKDLGPGGARASFWLNRKGRIESDLLLVERGDETVIDVDIHQAASTARALDGFVFTEDVEIVDVSPETHHLAIHGRAALETAAAAADRPTLELAPMQAVTLPLGGVETIVARRDQTGEVGLECIAPYAEAERVWDALIDAAARVGDAKRSVRPIGWFAYNIARVEAGTPLFNVDFGTTSLPQETGLLADRVSFTKGCYLGQEVVARIESQGRPRQVMIGLRMLHDRLPVAGDQVFETGEGGLGDPIGTITSSTLSPMLGAAPIALAVVRTAHAEIDQVLRVTAEGEPGDAVVQRLPFWTSDGSGAG